jgi:HPt (histidine-containing phosphotransfer) domain-containing protein
LSEFDESYQQLRLRFLERTRQDLVLIRAEHDPAKLRPVVHRLAGAAGTFGFGALSRVAGEVDDVLVEGGAPSDTDMARLTGEIETALGASA